MITAIEAARSKTNKSNDAKLQQFRAVTVAHPHLLAARERLMAVLSDAPRNSVIFVLGQPELEKAPCVQGSRVISRMRLPYNWRMTLHCCRLSV
jgi:hypothetical protein